MSDEHTTPAHDPADRQRPHGRPALPRLDGDLLDAASAVADGVADADERALVAGADDAQAWVAGWQELRAELVDVPVPAGLLGDHLAAALAAFDAFDDEHAATWHTGVDTPAAAALAVPSAPVRSLDAARVRRRNRWVLSGAAACFVLVAATAIVLGARRGDDADLAGTADVATSVATQKADAPNTEAESETDGAARDQASGGGAAPSTIDGIPGAAEIQPVSPAPAPSSGEPSDDGGTAGATFATTAPPLESVRDLPALSAWVERHLDDAVPVSSDGASTTGASEASTPTPDSTLATECAPAGDLLLGEVLFGADEDLAVVYGDSADGAIRVVGAASCALLAEYTRTAP